MADTKLAKEIKNRIKGNYGLSKDDTRKLAVACLMMPSDPDGVWSILDDEGIHIEYDDIATLCNALL